MKAEVSGVKRIGGTELVIAVDIGGTHLSCAGVFVGGLGIVEESYRRVALDSNAAACKILSDWKREIDSIASMLKCEVSGIGFAMPGPFDYNAGIGDYRGVPKLQELFAVDIGAFFHSTETCFINDATAYVLGECFEGSCAEYKRVLGITLGTGFGSTFVADRHPVYDGPAVPKGGFLYNQPYGDGIVDDYFSTRWFLQRYADLTGRQCEGVGAISDLATEGDAAAQNLFSEFGRRLGVYMAPWLAKFEADALLVGGGIANGWQHFKDSLQAEIETPLVRGTMGDRSALIGAAHYFEHNRAATLNQRRLTRQYLLPARHGESSDKGYEIYPSHPLINGRIGLGYADLADWFARQDRVVVDGYIGVFWDEFVRNMSAELARRGKRVIWMNAGIAMLSPGEIKNLVQPFLGDELSIFGTRCTHPLSDFFHCDHLKEMHPDETADITIVYGSGAALAGWEAPLVYLDLPKNELQFRMRAGAVCNLGADTTAQAAAMYKRFYFVDWPVLNEHKRAILPRIDLYVDAQRPETPVFASGVAVRDSLADMSENLFRARPWFEPGAWGGSWIKDRIAGLAPEVPNYAWSFELITPENGLLLNDDRHLMEVSFDLLMYLKAANVLGAAYDRFGVEFPIRFDFLDTFNGGSLSVQCHPRPEYIEEQFGENFTQDEAYYILDAQNEAKVYLGFQDGIEPAEFKAELEKSQAEGTAVDIDKYVMSHDSKKHDFFLMPNGTIHGSGKDNMVLEISSTPYIFTFKIYDWLRLDLDGNPRPINIEHAFNNLYFDRQGSKVVDELISVPKTIESGENYEVIHLPTHRDHFYDVHRLEFDTEIDVDTGDSCHVLMLVEGESISVVTAKGRKMDFSYSETFVIPAAAGSYRIVNNSSGRAKVVKAFIKEGQFQ